MGWFSPKNDPLSQRSRELKSRISSLEAEIKKLSSQVGQAAAMPAGQTRLASAVPAPADEPIFENVEPARFKSDTELLVQPEHYNEMGLRKFNLPGLWRRWQHQFSPKPVGDDKLVKFLAAGSIQGLRPLRYEKRVARNRFMVLAGILLLVMWGLAAVFFQR